jgi:predicted RNase H-like HicB family nuclease
MYRFLIVIEKANGNYSAYSPDLPGCVAKGAIGDEAEQNMHQAVEMHIKGLREDGLPVPESRRTAESKKGTTEQRWEVDYFNVASTAEGDLRNRPTHPNNWWRCRDLAGV